MKTFKSQRAAQMAMTKAEKAYEAAASKTHSAYRDAMEAGNVDPLEASIAASKARDEAYAFGAAVYDQAKAQGFWVRCWHFGSNPTRDLIAANMD